MITIKCIHFVLGLVIYEKKVNTIIWIDSKVENKKERPNKLIFTICFKQKQ